MATVNFGLYYRGDNCYMFHNNVNLNIVSFLDIVQVRSPRFDSYFYFGHYLFIPVFMTLSLTLFQGDLHKGCKLYVIRNIPVQF